MASAAVAVALPVNAAPPSATPAQIVSGAAAQPGPSGKPETVVAIHHPHSKHYLVANEQGKLSTHSDFNAPHHVAKHRHHGHAVHGGHFHVEHHGTHHRIRTAHGHYLHSNAAGGQVHTAEAPHHLQGNWQFIADAEAHKHHLQGDNGQLLQFTTDPVSGVPEPTFGAAAPSAATAIQVVPPAVAASTPAGTSPAPATQ